MAQTANLLDMLADQNRRAPLADVLRPKTLADYLGQHAVIGEGTPLRNLIDTRELTNVIFWGPPGVGKTTLARMIAEHSHARFVQMSAVNSGVKELREAVENAREALKMTGTPTVVFIDEIHRYSKTQQDGILPHVEDGTITIIGATTENPSFQVISALLSRVIIVRLDYLDRESIRSLVLRGVAHLKNISMTKEALNYIVDYANGDGRSALTLLETAYRCAPLETKDGEEKRVITLFFLETLAQQNRLNYDRQGDEHYDHASAYQKSMRGSDPDGALYWLGKMIAGGEDPRFIARRLIVTASEDVGLADPMALLQALAAADAVERLGLPEGRIPLAQATAYVARAPKSNAVICAIDDVLSDIQSKGKSFPVPKHLRDAHYSDAKKVHGHGVGYVYSHSNPDAPQTFLPDELADTKYLDF